MKNVPLTSIKISDKTFKKLQEAIGKSGIPGAEVRRIALRLGLDSLERIGFERIQDMITDQLGAAADAADAADAPAPLKSVPDSAKAKKRKGA